MYLNSKTQALNTLICEFTTIIHPHATFLEIFSSPDLSC